MSHPRTLTHVALTVPDLDRAVDFYTAVFGLNVIFGPEALRPDETRFGQISREIYGGDFGSGSVVFLGTANGVVLELFQFEHTPNRRSDFDYWNPGFFHICFVDPDVDGLVQRAIDCGGSRASSTWLLWDGRDRKLAFCRDPFGNVLEIYSHSTEQIVSNLHA